MNEKILEVVRYMVKEEWSFSLVKDDDGTTELRFAIFDGTLILNIDGTWDYEED